MADTIIYEDAEMRVLEATSVTDPDMPGGWRSRRVEYKAGSRGFNEEQMKAKLESALAAVETAAETKAAWDALTAAQRQEANRRVALAVCKLARLTLGRLEANE